MAKLINRYCGDVKVSLRFVRVTSEGRSEYCGRITVGDKVWKFANLCSGVGGCKGDEVSAMASSAIGFAAYYTSHNRGSDVPEWAPSPEIADAIQDGAYDMDDSGNYIVTRRSGA